ncbi:hypothetical protein FJT64_023015 [Amphibalanus amphitrite]|uniref:Kringle domain-containing protein n=1 Tax=Amphibalanus amphitrite TaxID=1232801 RepID=A0A6A4WC98_AMPAM|nr:hypothetical protein FJT64_023015 [Amphibalanus amphitrite]
MNNQVTVSQVPSLVKRDCMMDYWGWLYAGDESVTYFDRECQNWITRRGNHKVDPKLEFYDPGAKAKAGNKCRQAFKNGLPLRPRPWCYTVDPRAEKEMCDVPHCRKRREGCITGLCMEFLGYSHYGVLRPNIETKYGTGCNLFLGTGYMKLINERSYPSYLQQGRMHAGCANPAMGKNNAFGRLTGPWCPIRSYPGSPYRLRWAPCELPLVDDKEPTNPVHYTHAEYENRLMVFWRIRSATVRLEAGMVEFGYAGEGRPLIKTNVDSVGNLAYIATSNDQLDPDKQRAEDERRHINMWAFQEDQLSTETEDETRVENVYCQEFSTIGPAWYTHLFKMRSLTDADAPYLGDIYYDDKVQKWDTFEFERYFGANIWLRAHPTGTVLLLSTWPGVSSKYTVNVKIHFNDGKVDVGAHYCDPNKWMAGCVEYMRSQNKKYKELKSTKFYMNNSEPFVRLSLTKWTRLMIISQAKIFRIITFDDITGKQSGAFSYDLTYFGFMSESEFNRLLRGSNGRDEVQRSFFKVYDTDRNMIEAHQFRYIGFGTDGDRRTPPHVSFIRLHCKNGDPTPLTKYPNCLQDSDPISSKFFQGSWSVTETGEQCTSWSGLLDKWHRLPGEQVSPALTV